MFAENAGRPDLWQRGVKAAASGSITSPPAIAWSAPHLTPVTGTATFHTNAGGCWACYENGFNSISGSNFAGNVGAGNQTTGTVCFFNCTNEKNANCVYSFHPGTGGVAMADGSVHFLSENISIVTFCAMITPEGRAPVTDSF